MKTRLLLLLIVIASAARIFASTSLNASYKTEKISMNCFLCHAEELSLSETSENEKYKILEKKFFGFLYFADSLLEISSKLDSKISFYSEHDLSELAIGEKKYLFVSQRRAEEIQSSEKNFIVAEEYNDPVFIVSFICREFKIKVPQAKNKNRKLYSLEVESIPEIDFSETSVTDEIFFYPCGEVYCSPLFEKENRHFMGFYYSLKDARKMQKALQEEYCVNSAVKEFPLDFDLIYKAYFKIAHQKN